MPLDAWIANVVANDTAAAEITKSVTTCWTASPGRYDEDISLPLRDRQQQALRLLQEARARLAQPGVWIQGHDKVATIGVPGGYRFCARGVIYHMAEAFKLSSPGDAFTALAAVASSRGRPDNSFAPRDMVVCYNDQPETELVDVLAWFGRAIAAMERELVKSTGVMA